MSGDEDRVRRALWVVHASAVAAGCLTVVGVKAAALIAGVVLVVWTLRALGVMP